MTLSCFGQVKGQVCDQESREGESLRMRLTIPYRSLLKVFFGAIIYSAYLNSRVSPLLWACGWIYHLPHLRCALLLPVICCFMVPINPELVITAGQQTKVQLLAHNICSRLLLSGQNGRTQDGSEVAGLSRKTCKRQVTKATFDKWQQEYERDLQMLSWLCCDLQWD